MKMHYIQSKIIVLCLIGSFLSIHAGKNKNERSFLVKNNSQHCMYVATYRRFFDNLISKIGESKKVKKMQSIEIYRPKEAFELAITLKKGEKLLKKEFANKAEKYISLNRISLPSKHNTIKITQDNLGKIMLRTEMQKEKTKTTWCPDIGKHRITRKAIFNNT